MLTMLSNYCGVLGVQENVEAHGRMLKTKQLGKPQ